VKRRFGRRKREDQPSVACVNRLKAEYISEECSIGGGIPAEHDHVRPVDHTRLLSNIARHPERSEGSAPRNLKFYRNDPRHQVS
jgi:hypothetical protein